MPQELISVDEARQIILDNVPIFPARVALSAAAGLVLTAPAIALANVPSFSQSSMDGYAIRIEEALKQLIVQGIMPAGAQEPVALKPGHAMRIFTGGPLPQDADTIVVQENARRVNDFVRFTEPPLHKGHFVRKPGADTREGDTVLATGTLLTPVLQGLLAGTGIREVDIAKPPKVTVIATGNEFAPIDQPLAFGQIYESNGLFLKAALDAAGVRQITLSQANDTLAEVKTAITAALENSDIVILTGGVSVGDFDFVRRAADECQVICQFHKVKQKPGKPLYFGTKGTKLVFGLPGNPGSVVTCFYEYVLPAIQKMMGRLPSIKYLPAVLQEDFVKVAGLTQFLKGFLSLGQVSILNGQESFRLRSFAEANCLVRLEAIRVDYKKGETVNVKLLPS